MTPSSAGAAVGKPASSLAAVTASVAAAPAASRTRLFAANSVWNAQVPSVTPLDPSSGARVAALSDMVDATTAGGTYPSIAANTYSTPIYRVGPDAPTTSVKLDTGPWGLNLQAAFTAGVPIPANAAPAVGTDGHMTVYQPSTDTMWEFWRANKQLDGWHASWGGAMRNVSTKGGYYTAYSWPALPYSDGWNWGSTASSLPVAAGTATLAELRSGRIDHALAASIPAPCKGSFSWPAQRTDGISTDVNCMPEGAHLRLDPSIDVASLGLPRVTRILAVAAQRYGIIIRDRTATSVSLYAESPEPGQPSPYTAPGGLFEGLATWKMLRQFPWRELELLPMTTCTKAPCQPPVLAR